MSFPSTLSLPVKSLPRRNWQAGPLLLISGLLHGLLLLLLSQFGGSGFFGNGNGEFGARQGDSFSLTWIPGGGGGNGGQGGGPRVDTVVPNSENEVTVEVEAPEQENPPAQKPPLVTVTPNDPDDVFGNESNEPLIAKSDENTTTRPKIKTRERGQESTSSDENESEKTIKDRQVAIASATSAGGMDSSTPGSSGDGNQAGQGTGNQPETGQGGLGPAGSGNNRINFFGLFARAKRVVYVIDASESMRQHHAMELAREKLLASLQELSPDTQFQIVFFNLTNHTINRPGERPKLLRATQSNLQLAKQFITGIQPDSGTDRLAAITQALGLDPDVIYLLTDADAPILNAKQLWEIRRGNKRKAMIHVVEFGKGGDLSRDSFLKQLARENDGKHSYVDLMKSDR